MQYKVVAAPMGVKAKGTKLAEQAATAYAAMINGQAQEGWEFVCFDSTVVTEVVCGCCDGTKTTIKMIVFRRP